MRRTALWPVMAILILGAAAPAALASWAYVAPETYLDEAELVVVGKMTQVNSEAGTGVIAITEVLKGDADAKQAQVSFSAVPRRQDGRPIMMHSAMITYAEGADGVWVLVGNMRDANGRYRLNTPGLHYQPQQVERVRVMLALLKEQPWGEPADGLCARTLVHRTRGTVNWALVHFAVKNVSDAPISIPGGMRVRAVLTGLDEGPKVLVDGSITNRPGAEPAPVKIAPGEARYVVYRYGVNTGQLQPGAYTVSVSLSYPKADGEQDVWAGELAAPGVKFTVGPRPAE